MTRTTEGLERFLALCDEYPEMQQKLDKGMHDHIMKERNQHAHNMKWATISAFLLGTLFVVLLIDIFGLSMVHIGAKLYMMIWLVAAGVMIGITYRTIYLMVKYMVSDWKSWQAKKEQIVRDVCSQQDTVPLRLPWLEAELVAARQRPAQEPVLPPLPMKKA